MTKVFCIFKRVIREFLSQPQALAALFFAPVAGLAIMLHVLNLNSRSEFVPKVAFLGQENSEQLSYLKRMASYSDQIDIVDVSSSEEAKKQLENEQLTIAIDVESSEVWFATVSDLQLKGYQKIAASIIDAKPVTMDLPLSTSFSYNNMYNIKDMSFANTLAPGFTITMIFFFVFFTGSMAFIEERSSGTMLRIMISPLRPIQLLLGYLMSFILLAFFQILTLFALYTIVLKYSYNGSVAEFFIICLTTATLVLLISIIISLISESQVEANQFIPVIMLPQMILAGFFDLSGSEILSSISYYVPLNLAFSMASGVMIKGYSLFTNPEIYNRMFILLSYIVALMAVNVLLLKRFKPKYKS